MHASGFGFTWINAASANKLQSRNDSPADARGGRDG
jgi:hypothetical protein